MATMKDCLELTTGPGEQHPALMRILELIGRTIADGFARRSVRLVDIKAALDLTLEAHGGDMACIAPKQFAKIVHLSTCMECVTSMLLDFIEDHEITGFVDIKAEPEMLEAVERAMHRRGQKLVPFGQRWTPMPDERDLAHMPLASKKVN